MRATSADSDLVQSVSTLVFYAGSVSAARALVVRHPSLLCCQLPSWTEFLTAFGLNKVQSLIAALRFGGSGRVGLVVVGESWRCASQCRVAVHVRWVSISEWTGLAMEWAR